MSSIYYNNKAVIYTKPIVDVEFLPEDIRKELDFGDREGLTSFCWDNEDNESYPLLAAFLESHGIFSAVLDISGVFDAQTDE